MNFFVKLGDGGGSILKKLHAVYGNGAPKATVVYKWVARYKEGQSRLKRTRAREDAVTTYNDENAQHVDELLATNRRISNC